KIAFCSRLAASLLVGLVPTANRSIGSTGVRRSATRLSARGRVPCRRNCVDTLIAWPYAGSRVLLRGQDRVVNAPVHAQGEPPRLALRTAASDGWSGS